MKLILIVLDDPGRRARYNRVLRSEPYRIVYGFDGEDGFDRFFETKPDLIVVYESVARLDGSPYVHAIRQQPGGGTIPVIVLGQTPEDPEDVEMRCRALEADAYLDARASLETLKRSIQRLLVEGRPDREPSVREEVREEPEPPVHQAAEVTMTAERQPRAARKDTFTDEPVVEGTTVSVPVPDTGDLLEPELLEENAVVAFSESTPFEPVSDRSSGGPAADRPADEVSRESTPASISDDDGPLQSPERVPDPREASVEDRLGELLTTRVQQTHALLEQVDHYRLLGVERTATLAEIRKAHFDLALEFHPDRFFLLPSGDTKEKIYAIYRRLAEALRILAHEERRGAYDAFLEVASEVPMEALDEAAESSEPAVVEAAPLGVASVHAQALDFAGRAQAALQDGDLHGARLHLTLARAYDPENLSIEQALRRVVRVASAP